MFALCCFRRRNVSKSFLFRQAQTALFESFKAFVDVGGMLRRANGPCGQCVPHVQAVCTEPLRNAFAACSVRVRCLLRARMARLAFDCLMNLLIVNRMLRTGNFGWDGFCGGFACDASLRRHAKPGRTKSGAHAFALQARRRHAPRNVLGTACAVGLQVGQFHHLVYRGAQPVGVLASGGGKVRLSASAALYQLGGLFH